MKILCKFCFKLDNINITTEYMDINHYSHVDAYIREVICDILENRKSRKFEFIDEESTKIKISNICSSLALDDARDLALKLAQAEHDIKNKHPELGLDEKIKSGLAIVALVEDDSTHYFFFVKADNSEFINIRNNRDELLEGLLRDKKRYRVFLAEYTIDSIEHIVNYSQLISLDKTSPLPNYWIEDFLHLKPIYQDDDNTKKAFKAVTTRGLNQIKDKFPYAYTVLSNMVIGEFSSDGEINYPDFINKLCNCSPIKDKEITEELKNDLLKYPDEVGFDDVFIKKPDVVSKIRKTTIKLNEQIDLVLKAGANIDDETIKAIEKDGVKYLVIRTDEGYRHFHHEEK